MKLAAAAAVAAAAAAAAVLPAAAASSYHGSDVVASSSAADGALDLNGVDADAAADDDDDDDETAVLLPRTTQGMGKNLTAPLDGLTGVVVDVDAGGSGTVVDSATLRRSRRRGLQGDGKFHPLPCNDVFDTATPPACVLASTLALPPPGTPFVVPCGECVEIDLTGDVAITGGIDVQGKLKFPPNHKVAVTTPFVYVQGILEIRDTNPIAPENESVVFVLDGSTPQTFVPHGNNSDVCVSDPDLCDVGVQPFVVAGGRLDVEAMDGSCPAWTTIHDVVPEDMTTADYFQPVAAPAGCDRTFSDATFEDAAADVNVHAWRSALGSVATVETEGAPSNSYLRVANRTRSWQGPYMDLAERKACVQDGDVDYVFSAKVRLTKAAGGQTDCSATGTNCPRFVAEHRDGDDNVISKHEKRKMLVAEGLATTDGEWFTLTGLFRFTSNEAEPETVYEVFYIDGPEADVIIDVDDLYIGLPKEDMYPAADAGPTVCDELFTADHGADGYFDPPLYPYPLVTANKRSNPIRVLTEDDGSGGTNSYYRITDRYQEYESLSLPLPPGCVRGGTRYDVSLKIRINHPGDFLNVKIQFVGSSTTSLRKCPPMGGGRGWVECRQSIEFDQQDEDGGGDITDPMIFRVTTNHPDGGGSTDINLDVDYDDIYITLNHGPTKTLVVDESVSNCWGAGSQLMVTSHTDDWNYDQISTISSVAPSSVAGKSNVHLQTFVRKPTTEVDDVDQATEVALLDRNVKFTSLSYGTNSGAHLSILATSGQAQKLNGVQIKHFGEDKDYGAVEFHECDSAAGSVLSKNLVVDGHYRAVVLRKTEDVTVLENVAYNVRGHNFVTEKGEEGGSTFELNLAARCAETGSDKDSSCFYLRTIEDNRFVGNVAAGARKRGIYIHPVNAQRKKHFAAIHTNAMHSNDDYGLVLYNWYLESDDTDALDDFRIYKNEDYGAYLRGRFVTLSNSYVADNRLKGLDFHYCESCRLHDVRIVGVTPTYRDEITADPTVYFGCTDNPDYSNRPVGIELFHFVNSKSYWEPGANFSDVTFSGFEDSGCDHPAAISWERYRRLPHYDYFTQMAGTTNLDDGPVTFDLCRAAGEKLEIKDVLFTDLDSSLHPDGPGTITGPSAIVSNYDYMKGFSPGPCVVNSDMCYAYCEGACYRFVNLKVDAYGTENVTLVVTDTATLNTIVLPGNIRYDWSDGSPNVYANTYDFDLRVFSMPLPAGTYTAQFMKDGAPYWPTFAEFEYEPAPACGGAAIGSVSLIQPMSTASAEEPVSDCSELVLNGGGELNNYTHWYHISGGVAFEAGVGVDGTGAIVSTQRDSVDDGLAFFPDTRCIKENVGKEYELTAMIHLRDDAGADWTCDAQTLDDSDGCPRFYVKAKIWNEGAGKYDDKYWSRIAVVARPYNTAGYTLMHGTFVIPQIWADADSVKFYIRKGQADLKYYLDNVSLHPLQTPTARNSDGCDATEGGELVVNGDFETDPTSTIYWDTRRGYSTDNMRFGDIAVIPGGADGTGHALRVSDRQKTSQGPLQWINPGCLIEGQEYQVVVRFKLSNGGTGAHITCDKNLSPGSSVDACPKVTMYSRSTSEVDTYKTLAYTSDPGSETVWGTIHDTFNATSTMADAYKSYIFVEMAGLNVDLTIDDFSVTPYILDCDTIVKNGDFEEGNLNNWGWSGTPVGSIYNGGANSSAHAFMVSGRTDRSWGPQQELTLDCLAAETEYEITAKFKLENGGSLATCDPNVILDSDGCPTATLISTQTETRYRDVAAVVGSADAEGWYTLKGIFVMYASDMESDTVYLRIRNAPVNLDLIVDEVVVTEVQTTLM